MSAQKDPSEHAHADVIRKKYLYRRMIQKGNVPLHYRSASRLIGPDCAYHLYGQHSAKSLDTDNEVDPEHREE